MKEVTFKGYVRSYGVRAIGEDMHIIHALYDEVHDDSGSVFSGCECEVTVRVIDRRQGWIDKYYNLAMSNLGFTHDFRFCKDVTILASYSYPAQIVTAAPRHGDKYNRETGIAVAYAKWIGDEVPDYI